MSTPTDLGARSIEDRRPTARALRRALVAGRVVPRFQPVVDLVRGGLVGFEALARLVEPGTREHRPEVFLPVARQAGLVEALDRAVLEAACSAVAGLHASRAEAAELRLAVNVSGRHLAGGRLATMVRGALAATGLDPASLVLELTESELAPTDDRAVACLAALRGAGVGLALDDFGTAFNSLAYVQRFPVTQLKVDCRFVAGLGTGGAEEAIVDSVCHLARRLGATVVAEGVERPWQAAVLADLGCHLGQGHLFGRPEPLEVAAATLGAWRRAPRPASHRGATERGVTERGVTERGAVAGSAGIRARRAGLWPVPDPETRLRPGRARSDLAGEEARGPVRGGGRPR